MDTTSTNGNRDFFILRGLPNSGKSTLGEILAPGHVYAGDDYWYELMAATGKSYHDVWNPAQLADAHAQCMRRVLAAIDRGEPKIALANTNLNAREYRKYADAAENAGYRVHYIVVERGNSHGDNTHGVPDEFIKRMAGKFQFHDRRYYVS